MNLLEIQGALRILDLNLPIEACRFMERLGLSSEILDNCSKIIFYTINHAFSPKTYEYLCPDDFYSESSHRIPVTALYRDVILESKNSAS